MKKKKQDRLMLSYNHLTVSSISFPFRVVGAAVVFPVKTHIVVWSQLFPYHIKSILDARVALHPVASLNIFVRISAALHQVLFSNMLTNEAEKMVPS